MVNQEDHHLNSPPGKMAQNNNPYNAPSTAQMIEGLDPNAPTEPKKFGTYGTVFLKFLTLSKKLPIHLVKIAYVKSIYFYACVYCKHKKSRAVDFCISL